MLKKSYNYAIPLFFIFLLFKLANYGLPAQWDWIWIFSPLWIPIAVVIALAILIIFLVIILLIAMFVVSIIWHNIAPKSYAAMIERRKAAREKKELEEMQQKPPSPSNPNRSAWQKRLAELQAIVAEREGKKNQA